MGWYDRRSQMRLRFDVRKLGPGQRRFLLSRSEYVLAAGGYGSGKTTVGALKILQLASENPGVPGLVVAQSIGALKSTIMVALGKMLPGGRPRVIDPSGMRYITLDGTTPIYLRGAHNPGLMDGLDCGWGYMDEARYATREAYEVFIGRVRGRVPMPQIALTSTPRMNWLAEEFDSGRPNREVITIPTRENADNLSTNYIPNLRLSYSKRLQKAIIDGRFCVLEGAVYDAFDSTPDDDGKESPWIIDYDHRKHAHKRTMLFVDPGYRRPAVIWVRELSPMRWIVFHQDMSENLPMTAMADRINAWNRKHHVNIDSIWVDPAANQKSQSDHVDVISAMQDIDTRSRRPLHWITGVFASVTWGVERVRVMLGDPSIEQPIRMFFSKELRHSERSGQAHQRGVIKSLQSYAYPDIKDGRVMSDYPAEDPLHSHACAAMRYGCVGLSLTTPALRMSIKEAREAKATGVHTK